MLNCARQSEKSLGYLTSNGVKGDTGLLRPKCTKIMETIQLIKTLPRHDERVKTLKSYLRSLQRKNLFESSKSKA